ncbi:MAG: type I 3-dehydroquinate dehydratase [Desulfobaccales bacterium]
MPVVEEVARRARGVYLRAARKGCWAELRLDYLERVELRRLLGTLPGPVVVTNRHPAEGGRWRGAEAARLKVLEEALAYRPTCVDVEWRTEAGWRREVAAAKGETRLILSWHDFAGTPPEAELVAQLEAMLAAEGEIVKIVTLALRPEDNLRVLGLIPRALAAGKEIIAFCMGALGSWSRVAAPYLGSYLTYAPFHRKGASAPGQLTVSEVKRIWRLLRR